MLHISMEWLNVAKPLFRQQIFSLLSLRKYLPNDQKYTKFSMHCHLSLDQTALDNGIVVSV